MTVPLLVVGHAADRTGPPLHLLCLLRWLRSNRPDVELEVALLSGGELLDELRSLVPVTVFEPLPGDVPGEERERILRGELDEAAWWADRRSEALAAMMAPFTGSRVVYVNGAPAAELARALPPGDRVVLSHVHELAIGLVHRLSDADRRQFLHDATRLLSVADAVTRYLVDHHGVDLDDVELHRGLVDVASIVDATAGLDRDEARRARGLDPEDRIVVACGTTEFRKGTDLFLRVARELHADEPGRRTTFAWIGGDDAGVARARARADAMGLGDVVRFVGPQADPAAWFAAGDVFLMPSREDPFPLVCVEAAAAGTPTVAFDDAGGMPELLTQGCGVVVPYPDVARMAGAVRTMLDDEAARGAMGARGRELALSQLDVGVAAPRTWAAIERWL